MKAMLIDDELASLEALQVKIKKVMPQAEILGIYFSPREALRQLPLLDPDVVFLDVEMPGVSGFDFLEALPNRDFEVIITTAHDEYAVQAIKQSVVDFLLKPISLQELHEAIERLQQKLAAKQLTQKEQTHQLNAQFDKIPVPSMRGITFIPVRDLMSLEAEGNYTIIKLANHQQLVSSRKLGEYDTLLQRLHFFRIHHSAIINLAHIKEYVRGEGGTVILTNGSEYDVSKRRKKEFLEAVGW